jgi:hypothetical protein
MGRLIRFWLMPRLFTRVSECFCDPGGQMGFWDGVDITKDCI